MYFLKIDNNYFSNIKDINMLASDNSDRQNWSKYISASTIDVQNSDFMYTIAWFTIYSPFQIHAFYIISWNSAWAWTRRKAIASNNESLSAVSIVLIYGMISSIRAPCSALLDTRKPPNTDARADENWTGWDYLIVI
jgi:hypothetical protein